MSEAVWVEDTLVSAIHDRQLVEHGGAEGVRMGSLRLSPRHHFVNSTADIVDLCAKYTADIVQNRPFVGGNKRTGFVVGVLFLELNGLRFTASEAEAAQVVLELAAGTIDEVGFRDFLRANVERL